MGIQGAYLLADPAQLRFVDEIGLVEQYEVRHGDLIGRHFGLLELLEDLLGVHHGDDGVELHEALQRGNVDERLRHRTGIGDARGLDEDVVEAARLSRRWMPSTRSLRTVQHTQPLLSSTISSFWFSTSWPSMPILPISLTMIANLYRLWPRRM